MTIIRFIKSTWELSPPLSRILDSVVCNKCLFKLQHSSPGWFGLKCTFSLNSAAQIWSWGRGKWILILASRGHSFFSFFFFCFPISTNHFNLSRMTIWRLLTSRIPSFRTLPTFYLSFFVLLAYLRLLICYSLEHCDLNFEIQVKEKMMKMSDELRLNLSTSESCQLCAAFWLGKYLSRGVVSLVEPLTSTLCWAFK